MSSASDRDSSEFHLSRLTIGTKLMLIISAIIGVALIAMIAIATYFFKNDNTVRIQETNIDLNRVYARNLEYTLQAIARNVRLVASVIDRYPNARGTVEDRVFENNENLIFVGVYEGNQLAQKNRIVNPDFLIEHDLVTGDIAGLTARYAEQFRRSLAGQMVIVNVSPGFRLPLVGMSFPYDSNRGGNRVIVAFFHMDVILGPFQTSGIRETFMVSDDGTVVAHSDISIVLEGARLNQLGIVQAMQESAFDNGQMSYEDAEGNRFLGAFHKIEFAGLGIVSTVAEDKAFQAVYQIQRWNSYLTVVFICLAILGLFFYSRQLTRPILKLVRAARQIEVGNYAVAVVPEYRDEIGLLTNSFNQMSIGLQERENLKDSFGKFVNREIAEMSMAGKLSLGGERKECAIFFSDIRGFTSMSEKLRPEEVVEFLNEYFTEMVRCVNESGGVVDKFIGDAIMATWGALRTTGHDTQSAIDAALMMRQALIRFNRGRGTARRPIIHIGAGINAGPVIAGQIGSEERLEYTVIGDAVNLASRVESLTKSYGVDILITDFAYAHVRGLYSVERMDEVRVKGKSQPVTVYAVLGRQDDR
ncbi:MAG: HAMP domain-containing protein, partial [Leptospiraceae bacterium]|nr:HAMP domain-containing protein [Leptospiraceae bacterium]